MNSSSSQPPHKRCIRAAFALAVTAALLATACGSSTPLQGDTAAGTSDASVAASTPTSGAAVEPAQESNANEDDTDSDPDGTQIELATEAEPTPSAVAEPLVPTELVSTTVATGGAVDFMLDVEYTVGDTVSTNANLRSIIAGAPEYDDDEFWLVTELAIDVQTYMNSRISLGDIALVGPDGQIFEAKERFNDLGRSESPAVKGRTFRTGRIAFATPALITDTTGWHLHIATDMSLPLVLPLTGSRYDHSYPIGLADGSEGTIDVSVDNDFCSNPTNFPTKVIGARVDIEERSGTFRRAPRGERLVVIDLRVTNTATGTDECALGFVWRDFVLNTDGRPIADPTDAPSVSPSTSETLTLVFQIPADATTLELQGPSGRVLGNWEVDLPLAAGEAGAELVPFGSPVDRIETPAGPRPDVLTTEVIAQGEATGTFYATVFGIRNSTATTSVPAALLQGSPEHDDRGRTWLIAELDVEDTDATEYWILSPENLVLVDPNGRPQAATEIYTQSGETDTATLLEGPAYHDLRIVFETNGLITDPTGWSIQIEEEDRIPQVLPLSGPAPESAFPVDLATPVEGLVPSSHMFCSDGLLQATIDAASVEIEPSRTNERLRAAEPNRLVTMDLTLTNISDGSSECRLLGLWPRFLLNVDGLFTKSFTYDTPDLDPGEPTTIFLRFEVPKETQVVSLVGGSERTVIGSFELKTARQVLDDFASQDIEERTVITLDETLLFAFGSSTLQQTAIGPLTRVANVVTSESEGEITIVGHTDSIGDDAANQSLSLARAQAVADALVEAGVDVDRLVVVGQGEAEPVAPNENDDGSDNPAGRAENRRVEISFTTDS